ncbi:hypothetical protein B856_18550 (plasmid) [Acinetobacter baumannii AC30]|nr:hypothetical protein B856_18550 [Acinetobacter baumannii AC30]
MDYSWCKIGRSLRAGHSIAVNDKWAEWMIKRDDSFLNYCCWRQLYGEWQFHLDIDKVDQEASHLWKI